MSRMIRKQIYIAEEQDALLKRAAEAAGVSEAEIIRQALDARLLGQVTTPARPVAAVRSAPAPRSRVPRPAPHDSFRPEFD